MIENLAPCPLCGCRGIERINLAGRKSYSCENQLCPLSKIDTCYREWQTRPIEDALRKRAETVETKVAELEQIIIEADAQYNIDKKSSDIELASLSLVRMCSYGREAMDRVAELEAEIKNRFVSFMGKPFSYWMTLQAYANSLNYSELIERIAELEADLKHEEHEKLTVAEADKSMIMWLRERVNHLTIAGNALYDEAQYLPEELLEGWRNAKHQPLPPQGQLSQPPKPEEGEE
jgi:hypothetical protein